MASVLTTPEQIDRLRLATLRTALRLEILGMTRSHAPTAYSALKSTYGFKGSRASVLAQANKLLET